MKKMLFTLVLLSLGIAGVNAQGAFIKRSDVSPALLSKHGAYYSIEDTRSEQGVIYHYMYFYADGTFYIGGRNFDSKISMMKKLDEGNDPYKDKESLILNDAWGSYYISNDTIYMERFSYTPGNEYSSMTTGMVAVIKSDNSFNMIKETCDWCGISEYYGPQGHVFDAPIAYNLHPLDRLPDPSLAWFRRKSWFIEATNADQKAVASVR